MGLVAIVEADWEVVEGAGLVPAEVATVAAATATEAKGAGAAATASAAGWTRAAESTGRLRCSPRHRC